MSPQYDLAHGLASLVSTANRKSALTLREMPKRKRFGVAEWLRVGILFGIAGFFISAATFTGSVGFIPDNMKTLCWIMLFTAVFFAVWFIYDVRGVTFQ